MDTRTVEVTSTVDDGVAEAIQAQVATIEARGGRVISVQVTSPGAATIVSNEGEPRA
jgi:hypothetical protein